MLMVCPEHTHKKKKEYMLTPPGSLSIRLAPTIRTMSSRLMAQLFFGENAG
jgi:hypothetical protein